MLYVWAHCGFDLFFFLVTVVLFDAMVIFGSRDALWLSAL
jgi:hypothetical protein